MDGTNHKSRGYMASQPAHVQIRNTIQTMNTLKDGKDIRAWSTNARKELSTSSEVDVVNVKGDIIGTAPKLALVVVSRVFREHFEAHPEANQVKITSLSIDSQAVRHAAYKLGMEQYTRHFQKVYKDNLRGRSPLPTECNLLERLAVEPADDMVTGVGERLAYLRRRGEFDANSIAALAEFLKAHPKIQKAVMDADVRAARSRKN